MIERRASIVRKTKETSIELELSLSPGPIQISTSVDFLDHMLEAFARHAGCGLKIRAHGDGMDNHHVIEDVGIALGRAIHQALGDKAGIARFGSIVLPLDEALVMASIDISGRPFLNWRVRFKKRSSGALPTEMVGEFFRAVTDNGKITLHLILLEGKISHHICEATFKAFARAFAMAKAQGNASDVPSTKGILE